MSSADLTRLQRVHERAEAKAKAAADARNEAIYEALREGWTHAKIADATGLSRGIVSKFAKRMRGAG